MSETNRKIRPKNKAVALKYKPGDAAPSVVAKGAGVVAEKILERADENKISVYKDEALVEELSKVDIGDSIPPELYEVVAQVLIFISDLDRMEAYKNYGNSKK